MTAISLSLRSGYPADLPPSTIARWVVERVRAARAAGLDGLFVGDHHVVRGRAYLQNAPLLGRLLAEWGAAPAGALYLLPLWHPVIVAEQVATMAAFAEGPFVLQSAIGAGAEQFDGLGVPLSSRATRFEAALAIIRRLLDGQEVTTDGPWTIRGARTALCPASPVQVWIGGHADPALDRAARLGDGWLAGPDLVPGVAAELRHRYLDRCEVHKTVPAVVGVRRDVHVGASAQDARRVAEPILAAGYRGFDPAACVVGSVGQVAEQLHALGGLGFTDVVIRHLADEQSDVLASLERMAEVRRLVGA